MNLKANRASKNANLELLNMSHKAKTCRMLKQQYKVQLAKVVSDG